MLTEVMALTFYVINLVAMLVGNILLSTSYPVRPPLTLQEKKREFKG